MRKVKKIIEIGCMRDQINTGFKKNTIRVKRNQLYRLKKSADATDEEKEMIREKTRERDRKHIEEMAKLKGQTDSNKTKKLSEWTKEGISKIENNSIKHFMTADELMSAQGKWKSEYSSSMVRIYLLFFTEVNGPLKSTLKRSRG